jgi:CheY-like chemotaxis protein
MVETRFRVAVIDDDSVFVELMQDLLADGEGYDVVSCAHWVQSFEFVRDTQPDVVILDLMMGGERTGWTVLEVLREHPSTAHIPVVLCSAAAPELQKVPYHLNGGAAIEPVAKPFDVDRLLDVIGRLVQQGASQSIA